jgi:hypothetical protein
MPTITKDLTTYNLIFNKDLFGYYLVNPNSELTFKKGSIFKRGVSKEYVKDLLTNPVQHISNYGLVTIMNPLADLEFIEVHTTIATTTREVAVNPLIDMKLVTRHEGRREVDEVYHL